MVPQPDSGYTGEDRVEGILSRFQYYEESREGGWIGTCPNPDHPDNNPSCKIDVSDDGSALLLTCRSQECSIDDMCRGLGIHKSDLFLDNETNGHKTPSQYEIRDTEGKLHAIHKRLDFINDEGEPDKWMWWCHPDGTKSKDGEIKTKQLPLYGSERLQDVPLDEPVVVVEGESPAAALHDVGIPALGTVCDAGNTPENRIFDVLRGRKVLLWPDADKDGQKHMERVQKLVANVASEVRIFEWPDAPDKGDAANYPNLQEFKNRLSDFPNHFPHKWGKEYCGNKSEGEYGGNFLPLKSSADVIAEAGEGPKWCIEGIAAFGAVTDVSGRPKKGGKTTLVMRACDSVLDGLPFIGRETTMASILYLSEQGKNLDEYLTEIGLDQRPVEQFAVVQRKDLRGMDWEEVVEAAAKQCVADGRRVLVLDTFIKWAGLKGTEENNSGDVAEKLEPLTRIAQEYDLCIILIRHAGKNDEGRGSSAFEGEPDIVINIRKPEGNQDKTIRVLRVEGRYHAANFETNIRLTDDGYEDLGRNSDIKFQAAIKGIRRVVQLGRENALFKAEIKSRCSKETGVGKISDTTWDNAFQWLVDKGEIEYFVAKGKGAPKKYFVPSILGKERNEDDSIYFHNTPSANCGENPEPEKEEKKHPNIHKLNSMTPAEFREKYPPLDRSEALPADALNWDVLVGLEPRLKELEDAVLGICEESKDRLHFCEEVAFRGPRDGGSIYGRMQKLVGFEAENPKLRSSEAYDLAYDRLYDLLPYCRRCAFHTGPLDPPHPDALEDPTWADLCNTDDGFEELMVHADKAADEFVRRYIPAWRENCEDDEGFIRTVRWWLWEIRGNTAVEVEKLCVAHSTPSSDDAHMVGMTAIYGHFYKRFMEGVIDTKDGGGSI